MAEREVELRDRARPRRHPRRDRRGTATGALRRCAVRRDPPRGSSATSARGHTSCRRRASSPTTRPCCWSTRAWCRSSRTSSASRPRRTPAPPACRSACAPSTSTRSARPPGTARSSRWPATSASATTSRRARSSSPGTLLTRGRRPGGYGLRRGQALGHGLPRRRRGVRPVARDRRPRRAGSSAAARPTTTGTWACPGRAARAARSTTTAARSTAREGGPAVDEDRYLEVWNLVFMQYQLSEVRSKVDFDIAGPLPKQNIDTGMGLERMATRAAGRRQPLRDRHQPGDPRPRGRPDRRAVRRGPRSRRPAARRRRPRPHRRDAHRRRRHAVQRGPRLRAAPDHAPRGPRHAPARRATSRMRELVDATHRRDGPAVPRAGHRRRRASTRSRRPRRRLPRDAAHRRDHLRHRRPARRAQAGGVLSGERGVRAARHLRLPDRPDPGDGGRAGPAGRRAGLPRPHGRSSATAPRPTAARQEAGHADVSAYRALLERAGAVGVHRLRRGAHARRCCAACSSTASVAEAAPEGDEVEVVLDRTPFYAEGGGQLADPGRLVLADGTVLEVSDVQQPLPDLVVHTARVLSRRGAGRQRAAGRGRRRAPPRRSAARTPRPTWSTRRSATRWGSQATQAGSLNAPGRFRFDFASPAGRARRRAARRRAADQRDRAGRPRGARVRHHARTRRGGSARWRCSARSTATRSASSRSATTPASSAAARTPRAPASSAWSSCSASPRIGSGVRRVEGLVGLDAYPYLAREHVLLAQLADVVQGADRRRCPTGSPASWRACARSEKELGAAARRARCCSAPASSPPARPTSFGVRVRRRRGARRHARRPGPRARARRPRPARPGPPGAVVVAAGGDRVVAGRRGQRGRPGTRADGRRPAARGRAGGRRQGRRQGRRRPGRRQRRRPASPRRSGCRARSSAGCADLLSAAPGVVARGRRRHRARRRRRQRPAPGARQPGRDGARARVCAGRRDRRRARGGAGRRRAADLAVRARRPPPRPTWPGTGPPSFAPLVAPVPVELVDERLTTVTATARAAGVGQERQGGAGRRRPGRGGGAAAGRARPALSARLAAPVTDLVRLAA